MQRWSGELGPVVTVPDLNELENLRDVYRVLKPFYDSVQTSTPQEGHVSKDVLEKSFNTLIDDFHGCGSERSQNV